MKEIISTEKTPCCLKIVCCSLEYTDMILKMLSYILKKTMNV